MRKIIVLMCGWLLLAGRLAAQAPVSPAGAAIIRGKIIDSVSGKPLEYATITLLDKTSGKTLTGCTSNIAGLFALENISMGTYRLLIEFIGYKSFTLPGLAITKKNEIAELKNILLVKDAKMLSGVTVTAQAKLIENKIDKLVFNAEKDLTSQSGVATDVLKKVPQVSVDVDGNVELSGSRDRKSVV